MAQFAAAEHGLVAEIRAAVASEQFDLGGYTEQRSQDLIRNAFSTPLPAPTEMIRFQFIVGGGKLVRSRYPEELPKWVTAALRDSGFTEDRSAAETFDSQGTYKMQHDTGQNLKYVLVYPFVACANQKAAPQIATKPEENQTTPEYLVLACESAIFKDMVDSKISSYSQKKKALKFLQDKAEECKALEDKLISGAKLSDKEQSQYDLYSGSDIEKITYLQNCIKEMVDKGSLTEREKNELISHLDGNEKTFKTEFETENSKGNKVKADKIKVKYDNCTQRKQFVEKLTPINPRLKHGNEIRDLYLKIFPLESLEEKERSMSLTLADLKSLEAKKENEKEIKNLIDASRGWFEDEEDFQLMVKYEEKEARKVYKTKKEAEAKKKTIGGTSSMGKSSTSSNSWSTVSKKSGFGTQSKPAAKKSGGSSFAAAFGDSDSDD